MEKNVPSRPSYLYPTPGRVGLVLAGGAARGAYEVGVVQYIAEEVAKAIGRDPPLDIICGTSVGAINGCALAAYADYPRSRARRLVSAWRSLRIEDVLIFSTTHLMKFVRSGIGRQPTQAEVQGDRYGGLIDATGMEKIIRTNIPFGRIEEHLRSGLLTGVTTSATHISTGNTVVFIGYGGESLPRWSSDPKVVPRHVPLQMGHALASAAIPLLFPSVRIAGEFYCDGGLRQNVPLSPARHLGADGILVVSPRYYDEIPPIAAEPNPDARMPGPLFLAGKALNALLLDRVENDIERLQKINQLLLAGKKVYGDDFVRQLNKALGRDDPQRGFRPLASLLVRASKNMGRMAAEYVRSPLFARRTDGIPGRALRQILDSAFDDEADLLSYILFDGEFAMQLIELGWHDAQQQHEALCHFFTELCCREQVAGAPVGNEPQPGPS